MSVRLQAIVAIDCFDMKHDRKATRLVGARDLVRKLREDPQTIKDMHLGPGGKWLFRGVELIEDDRFSTWRVA